MMLFWPEQGWRHADTLAQQELARIPATSLHSLQISDPAHTSERQGDTSGSYTHDIGTFLYAATPFKQRRNWLTNAMLADAHTAKIFASRLPALTLCLPLFLATATPDVVDDLVSLAGGVDVYEGLPDRPNVTSKKFL